MAHLDKLKMRIRKYAPGVIYEFDTMDELREFDESYRTDTRSVLLKKVASQLGVGEEEIVHITSMKGTTTAAVGFVFDCKGERYNYEYETGELKNQSENNSVLI